MKLFALIFPVTCFQYIILCVTGGKRIVKFSSNLNIYILLLLSNINTHIRQQSQVFGQVLVDHLEFLELGPQGSDSFPDFDLLVLCCLEHLFVLSLLFRFLDTEIRVLELFESVFQLYVSRYTD